MTQKLNKDSIIICLVLSQEYSCVNIIKYYFSKSFSQLRRENVDAGRKKKPFYSVLLFGFGTLFFFFFTIFRAFCTVIISSLLIVADVYYKKKVSSSLDHVSLCAYAS